LRCTSPRHGVPDEVLASAVRNIPYGRRPPATGETTGDRVTHASRAVGPGKRPQNTISSVVTCHSVHRREWITHTGYGGGMDAKRWMLSHEAGPSRVFDS